MKYHLRKTTRYKKSLQKMLKRGKDIDKIANVVQMLANGQTLPPQFKDHPLSNNMAGLRDCHIENDSGSPGLTDIPASSAARWMSSDPSVVTPDGHCARPSIDGPLLA